MGFVSRVPRVRCVRERVQPARLASFRSRAANHSRRRPRSPDLRADSARVRARARKRRQPRGGGPSAMATYQDLEDDWSMLCHEPDSWTQNGEARQIFLLISSETKFSLFDRNIDEKPRLLRQRLILSSNRFRTCDNGFQPRIPSADNAVPVIISRCREKKSRGEWIYRMDRPLMPAGGFLSIDRGRPCRPRRETASLKGKDAAPYVGKDLDGRAWIIAPGRSLVYYTRADVTALRRAVDMSLDYALSSLKTPRGYIKHRRLTVEQRSENARQKVHAIRDNI